MASTAKITASNPWSFTAPARLDAVSRRRAAAWSASAVLHMAILAPWLWWMPEPEIVRVPDASPSVPVGLVIWSPPEPETPPTVQTPPPPAPAARPRPVESPTPAPVPVPRPEPGPRTEPIERSAPDPRPVESTETAPAPLAPAESSIASELAAAPPATPNATPLAVASADEIARYVSRVRGLIDDRKHYPRQAQRRGVEGTVLLRLLLTSTGRIGEIDVLDAAHGLLEKATRDAVDRVDEFPAPPDGVSWIEVAVRYDLDD